MSRNVIGQRLKYARTNSKPKVTQTDLIARLEIREVFLEKTAISKIESGKRPVNDIELIAIADALHVSVNWLLGLE